MRGFGQERLGQQETHARADGRNLARTPWREEGDVLDSHGGEQAAELVLHNIGQDADHEELLARSRGRRRRLFQQGGKTRVLPLREGRFDPAAGIVQHRKARAVAARQALSGAGKVELDHLRRAGPDKEQHLDIGTPSQQLIDHAVELVIGVGHTGEIALLHDGGGESRLGEDHHAGGGLDQMRAGAGADDQKEGVLDLAMQPDDAGQAAEDFPLAALAQDRRGRDAPCPGFFRAGALAERDVEGGHAPRPETTACAGFSRRAWRSFIRNWVALIA